MASNPIQSAPLLRGSLVNLGGLLALAMVACSGADGDDGLGHTGGSPQAPVGTPGGMLGLGGSTGGQFPAIPTAGTGPAVPTSGGTAPVLPSGGSAGVILGVGSGGSAGTGTPRGGAPGLGGSGGSSAGSGSTPPPGSAGAAPVARDHCVDGYAPDPTDEMMADGPVNFVKSGQTDTTVQPEVIKWMQTNVWEEAHFQWHNIRRCNGGMVITNRAGNLNPCKFTDIVPQNQEGKGPGDGLEFLAMHRHMIQSLKQLWPKHSEQFEGWEHFPQSKSDLPEAWQADWTPFSQQQVATMAKADDPQANINMWATEGDFGQWIQTTSQIHGWLHFKWVRTQNSEHGLGNQFTNIDNYMFWKMHGWIDKVWDRYRAAKGKKPTDPDIIEAVRKQCYHMDDLAKLIKPDLNPNPGANPTTCATPAPAQTGAFVALRSVFESATAKCTGCHGPVGPAGGLTLGGSECLKSSDIVAKLVNQPSKAGGQFKLVDPGSPETSWLYLKATNTAGSAGCKVTNGVQCIADSSTGSQMPPSAMTKAEQDQLAAWIRAGAPAPQ